jgi:hypothetical protein
MFSLFVAVGVQNVMRPQRHLLHESGLNLIKLAEQLFPFD